MAHVLGFRQKYDEYLTLKENVKNGDLPDATQILVTKNQLKHKFSDAMIDMLISKKPRIKSRKWSNEDVALTFKLKCLSPAACDFIRKNIIPLPSDTHIWRALSFVKLDTGFLKPIIIYMKHLRSQLKDPLARVSAINFDECSTAFMCEFDELQDAIRGKNLDRKHTSF